MYESKSLVDPLRSIYRISVAVTHREEYENYEAFVSPTKEETTKAIELVGQMLLAGGKALDMDFKDMRMEIYKDGASWNVLLDHSSLKEY